MTALGLAFAIFASCSTPGTAQEVPLIDTGQVSAPPTNELRFERQDTLEAHLEYDREHDDFPVTDIDTSRVSEFVLERYRPFNAMNVAFRDELRRLEPSRTWAELGLQALDREGWGLAGIDRRDFGIIEGEMADGGLPSLYFLATGGLSHGTVSISTFNWNYYDPSHFDFKVYDAELLSALVMAYALMMTTYDVIDGGWPMFEIHGWECGVWKQSFTCSSILCHPAAVQHLATLPAGSITISDLQQQCVGSGPAHLLVGGDTKTVLGRDI